MRGTVKKILCGRGMPAPERRRLKKAYKQAASFAGTPKPLPEPRSKSPIVLGERRLKLKGITRSIFPFFRELTATGVNKALNLRFGTERRHGSPESLRRWPRGRPGQGSASRLPKPEILRRIAGLQQFRNVNQTARFF